MGGVCIVICDEGTLNDARVLRPGYVNCLVYTQLYLKDMANFYKLSTVTPDL